MANVIKCNLDEMCDAICGILNDYERQVNKELLEMVEKDTDDEMEKND